MTETMWNIKEQQSIKAFLGKVGSIYEDLLQKEKNCRVQNIEKVCHLQEVTEELVKIERDFLINSYRPCTKPVCKGLSTESRRGSFKPSQKCEEIENSLFNHHLKFQWQYGYNNLSKVLQQKFAFAEVVGSQAPILSEKINLGFVLLSSDTDYPKHVHEGVDELYVNIGEECEINDDIILNGESYHVISGLPHTIKASEKGMGILLYSWVFPAGTSGYYGMRFVE